MKKTLLITLCLLFATSAANAEFYLGANFGMMNSKLSAKGSQNVDADVDYDLNGQNISASKSSNVFGLNFGYKIYADKFFFAPEIGFDIGSTTTDLDYYYEVLGNTRTTKRGIQISDRLYARALFGYQILKDFDIYASAGYANYLVDLDRTGALNAETTEIKGVSHSPLFGAGFIYNMNNDWGLRLDYDYQRITIKANVLTGYGIFINNTYEIPNAKIDMHNAKIGLMYSF